MADVIEGSKLSALYEVDEHAWIEQQVAALQNGDFALLDRGNLIDLLTAMAKRDVRELESRLTSLCAHVFKCMWQPEKETTSWHISIAKQQIAIKRMLKGLPTLKSRAEVTLREVYPDAISLALRETGLKRSAVVIPTSTEMPLRMMLNLNAKLEYLEILGVSIPPDVSLEDLQLKVVGDTISYDRQVLHRVLVESDPIPNPIDFLLSWTTSAANFGEPVDPDIERVLRKEYSRRTR